MANHPILTHAITLIENGEKAAAQRILEPYLQENPQDVLAWIWEARTWSALELRIKVLETGLTHNPNHPQLTTVLAALNTQQNQRAPHAYALSLAQRLNAI